MTQYFCATERRRDEVRRVNFLNGIDFVEVAIADQRTLLVHFIRPVAGLTKNNFRIVGGVRVTDVQVQALVGTAGEVVTLKTDQKRRLFDLHPAARDLRRGQRCAARVRSDARGGVVLVQGELPERFRLRARRRVRTAQSAGAAHQLPRQGLRELPQAAVRSPGGDDAGVARAQSGGPRRHARRAAGLCRRSAELLPGRGGDRGVPQHRAQPRQRAPARAPRRLRDARRRERARLAGLRNRRRSRQRRGAGGAEADAGHGRRRPKRSRRSPSRPCTR